MAESRSQYSRRRRSTGIALLAISIELAACTRAPDPGPAIANAGELIEQAERNGVVGFAAADLDQARELLQNARAAQGLGRRASAAKLAHEAAVEARLAIARTAATQANAAFAEPPPQ